MKQILLTAAQAEYVEDLIREKQDEADEAGKPQLVEAIDAILDAFNEAVDA